MNGLRDLKNNIKFAQFDLCIRFALVILRTEFHIFNKIISENHLAYVAILNNIRGLEHQVKVTRFELWSLPCHGTSVYRIW